MTAEVAGGRRASGYSLVVLIMAVTVLEIMLGAALPMWSERIKRDKEEELLSRGFQYAEAIRVFQRRFQRLPTSLDELIKVKPRCIRQLWKDPMTDDGQWELIIAGQGSPLMPLPGMPNPRLPIRTDRGQPPAEDNGTGTAGNGLDPGGQRITNGPIVGVHSRSTQKSLLIFFGQDEYDLWQFRVEMLTGAARVNPRVPGVGLPGAAPNLSTQWLGRPMPNFAPVGNGLSSPGLGSGPPGGGRGAGGNSMPGSQPFQ